MSDLISRQAVIDVLSDGKELLSRVLDDMDVVGTDREKYSWGLGLLESYIKDIEELPSAQPERMRGRWIPIMHLDVLDGYRCSTCKAWSRFKYNFCRNCGADMREVE